MPAGDSAPTDAMERTTICFPHVGTQDVLQKGDTEFKNTLDRLYHPAENDALEALVNLKAQLPTVSTASLDLA